MESKSWKRYALGDVCSVTDCQHKTAPTVKEETQYRMLRTTNIRNGKIDTINTKSVSQETYLKWSIRGFLEEGDVILTREAPMGEVGIIRKEKYNLFLGQRLLQLKAKKNLINPEFLFYSLQGRELQHQIRMNEGTGSVVSNIRIPILKKMDIFLPDLSTQKRIVDSLKAVDEKIAINELIVANLEQLIQTLFKRWFVDFEFPNEEGEPYKSSGGEMVKSEMGLMPLNWNVKKVTEFGDFKNGINYSRDTTGDSQIRVCNVRNIVGNHYLINDELDSISINQNKADGYFLYKGDTLIVRSASPGETVFINRTEKDLIYSGFVIRFRPKLIINGQFIFFHLKRLKKELDSYSTGTTLKNLNQQILKSIKVIAPKEELIGKFNQYGDYIIDLIQEVQEENNKLTSLRDTLLPKLLSGEIELIDETEVTEHVPIP